MATITIEITDTELKCMEYCALSPQEWIRNAAVARAKVASDEIIAILVNYCNNNEIALEKTHKYNKTMIWVSSEQQRMSMQIF